MTVPGPVVKVALSPAPDLDRMVAERDRLALILEVTRSASTLDLPELISQVGRCLRQSHWSWEHTSLGIYEPEKHAIRINAFYYSAGPLDVSQRAYRGGDLVPVEGSMAGLAFSTGTSFVANSRREYESLLS